jgi:hypothetical protein
MISSQKLRPLDHEAGLTIQIQMRMLAIDRGLISREFVQTNWSTISLCLIGTVGSSPRLRRPGRRSKKGKATGENCVIRSYIICALRHLLGQRLR